ncbi:MAG: type II toxin-antitoxin system RelB/DinJ family antitoxin [Defluviitaleaceae bacterium]|nr:type II toxin-antitoxin system RelB/DinJ family antitoxin [Defluviitaleaceae bacterium]
MSTTNITLSIDTKLKESSEALFESLGVAFDSVVTSLLEQSIQAKGLPFQAQVPKILTIDAIKHAVKLVVEKYDIIKVDVFGSYANGTATGESDVDLLIEFGSVPSLLTIVSIKAELEEHLKHPVDVVKIPLAESCSMVISKVVNVYERA